jgi:hypothetical protein
MILDFFEEEEGIEINVSSVQKFKPNSVDLVIDNSHADIDDIKMLIAETFIAWSERYGT